MRQNFPDLNRNRGSNRTLSIRIESILEIDTGPYCAHLNLTIFLRIWIYTKTLKGSLCRFTVKTLDFFSDCWSKETVQAVWWLSRLCVFRCKKCREELAVSQYAHTNEVHMFRFSVSWLSSLIWIRTDLQRNNSLGLASSCLYICTADKSSSPLNSADFKSPFKYFTGFINCSVA